MANDWFDSALTLKEKVYENLRKSKSRKPKARQKVTKESFVNEDNGYEEDDEDNLTGLPPSRDSPTPRVQIYDGPEGCSCFPKRSNKRIPSMLYEGVECKHTGLKGDTHAGVCKFHHNWREEYEEPDSEVMIQKTKYVLGYPRPVNLDSDLQYYDEEYQPADETGDHGRNKTQQSKPDEKKEKTKQPKRSFPYDLLDFMEEEGKELTPPNSRPFLEGIPISLPRIGYSPPPPSRERLSARSVARSLPPLPESPFLSSGQTKLKQSRTEKRALSELGEFSDEHEDESTRRSKRSLMRNKHKDMQFKGHYYDTAKKKTRSYEIKPIFRKGLDDWNAYIQDNNRQSSMISTLQGRRTTNGNFYTRGNNTVLEDDEYDDDLDDYDNENSDVNTHKNIRSRSRK